VSSTAPDLTAGGDGADRQRLAPPEQTELGEQADRIEQAGRTEQADRTERHERTEQPGRRQVRPPRPLRFWREVTYVALFYAVYSVVRNTQGSAAVSAAEAMRNALRVIRWEQVLGIYHEQAIQQAFLANRLFIELWNLFYGTFHFLVTGFALIFLFKKFPVRYRRWRNTLGFTTGIALVGFALYPLMPPRLLPESYGFVDTLKVYGSLWSFDSGTAHKISNQYAAMPSLHFAWSAWCALALVPSLRSSWAKILAAVYPALTLFSIVVTGNHYILDAVGGLIVLAAGMVLGFWLAGRVERRAEAALAAAAA
jgi:membrane-associated phospholipid phosphatase